jgi:hypothetical protein
MAPEKVENEERRAMVRYFLSRFREMESLEKGQDSTAGP